MKISLQRMNDAVHFRATNADGQSIDIDGSPAVGGMGMGVRPMEAMLASLAGCSLMDLVHIIKKQKMELVDIRVEVNGERADAVPSPFTDIHLLYYLKGALQEDKVRKALDLAVGKYCSAAAMLEKSARISWDFVIEAG